ncbi:MAG: hypothetical protein R3B40_22755 [Polyangiales bacterium]
MTTRSLSCSALLLTLLTTLGGCGRTTDTTSERPANGATASSEDPCPVLTAAAGSSRGGGVAPSLAGEDVSSDLDGMVASLPAGSAQPPSAMRRGQAGHWSPVAIATYANDGGEWLITVDDLVHVCTCREGMGEQLRQRAQDQRAGEARTLGGAPALVRAEPTEVLAWVGDRCALRVAGDGTPEAAWALAESVDLPRLTAACARP